MKKLELNEGWFLHEAPLYFGAVDNIKVKAFTEGWMACNLPSDIHLPLIENGIIKDPTKADYCLEAEWTEQRSWWYKKSFSVDKALLEEDIIELFIERIDTKGDVFVNDIYVGSQCDIHYPFIYDIKEFLKEGENELMVRVSAGLEDITDDDLSEISWACCTEYDNGGKYRGDRRRAFVRRPQYTIGWDWNPRVVTTGLTGKAYLSAHSKVAIREASVYTKSIDKKAVLDFFVNVENLDIIGSREADVTVKVLFEGKEVLKKEFKEELLTSGYNYINSTLEIEDPKVWWPSGSGKQPLYTMEISATCEGATDTYPAFRFAVRTLCLNTEKIDEENRRFDVIVNGTPIFAKGGDWIPSDTIYARVSVDKVKILLCEAKEANFNFLRIWGGGLYEIDEFYDLCDEMGILLWHDFMFACTSYPDHQEWFKAAARKEMDYQTKRLRNHACIGLFCGSNENHWLFNSTETPKWNIKIYNNKQYGLYVQNVIAREVMKNNCPQIPYWNSSPYGGKLPNSDTVGDVHIWRNAFMSDKMEERVDLRAYDKVESKFVSEYGYVGPCDIQSMRDYLDLKDGEEILREGRAWEMHLNVFEKDTVYAGIERFYKDGAATMSIEDYIKYGSMTQSRVYEYSLEAIRYKKNCGGAIFWMYNDAWGEVGWTIIDYFLRRKPSFYGVKRAFAPIKLSLRNLDGKVVVQGLNDTDKAVEFNLSYGYVSFDGATKDLKSTKIKLEPRTREYVLEFERPKGDAKKGMVVAIPESDLLDTASLFELENKELEYSTGNVNCVEKGYEDGYTVLELSSDTYAHGVHVLGGYKCSDNYFDILPGQKKVIKVCNPKNEQLKVGIVR